MLETAANIIKREFNKPSKRLLPGSICMISKNSGGELSDLHQFAIKQFLYAGHNLSVIFYDRIDGLIVYGINIKNLDGFKLFMKDSLEGCESLCETPTGTDVILTTPKNKEKLSKIIEYIKDKENIRGFEKMNVNKCRNVLIMTEDQYNDSMFLNDCIMYCRSGILTDLAMIPNGFYAEYPGLYKDHDMEDFYIGGFCDEYRYHRIPVVDLATGEISRNSFYEMLDGAIRECTMNDVHEYDKDRFFSRDRGDHIYFSDMNPALFDLFMYKSMNEACIEAYVSDTIYKIYEKEEEEEK